MPIIPAKFFSPNGDGVNDRWVVKAWFLSWCHYPNFDRFGKELISYHGYDLGWMDGTYDGKMMMTTDYWYLITVDEITKISGHFTLKK